MRYVLLFFSFAVLHITLSLCHGFRNHYRQQGLCGTIVSEQTFPDFNPGTLNYRIRQRELLRIDRANSALLHRLETASSGYSKALLKPKHFQEPHMGLFPR